MESYFRGGDRGGRNGTVPGFNDSIQDLQRVVLAHEKMNDLSPRIIRMRDRDIFALPGIPEHPRFVSRVELSKDHVKG